jgi:hypothetical protein
MSSTTRDATEAEIWSAIRYLDPDEVKKGRVEDDRVSKIATVMTLFVFAVMIVCLASALLPRTVSSETHRWSLSKK